MNNYKEKSPAKEVESIFTNKEYFSEDAASLLLTKLVGTFLEKKKKCCQIQTH